MWACMARDSPLTSNFFSATWPVRQGRSWQPDALEEASAAATSGSNVSQAVQDHRLSHGRDGRVREPGPWHAGKTSQHLALFPASATMEGVIGAIARPARGVECQKALYP